MNADIIREALEALAPYEKSANEVLRKFGLAESHYKRDALAALDVLEADNAKLREALQEIARKHYASTCWDGESAGIDGVGALQNLARAALVSHPAEPEEDG